MSIGALGNCFAVAVVRLVDARGEFFGFLGVPLGVPAFGVIVL